MQPRNLILGTLLLFPIAVFAQEQSSAELFHEQHAARFTNARHLVLAPQHSLRPDEIADLANHGVEVQQPIANGRYLVRMALDSDIDDGDPRIVSLQPLTVAQKLSASAYRAAARGSAFSRLRILFHDDVDYSAAVRTIESAGGEVDQPLGTFSYPRVIAAHVPSGNLTRLAQDERVLGVYGPQPKMKNDNATSAQLSNVTPLFSAPYGLTGNGVALSYFELAAADATHTEFGGRLTVHFTGGASSDAQHATHTAGTMIASGINSAAKGMAPSATLHGYNANTDTSVWLPQKQNLSTVSSVADNNSWGFILGWEQETSGDWLWTENDELIGGYEATIDAPIDHLARTNGSLMVHSAGNEGSTSGPTAAPFVHFHIDDNGDKIDDEFFCYSQDGSGTDCPTPTCSTGLAHCETVHHPTHNPYGSIGMTASSKNVISVGATDPSRVIASYSSRGPTRDARIKPEVSAKGSHTYSTLPSQNYGYMSGTSMAAPVVTGSSALLAEQWRKTFAGANPGPVALKTLIIAGADDLGNAGPDYTYGYGFLDTKASVDLIIADNATGSRIRNGNVGQSETVDIPMSVTSAQDVRVVLGWFDQEVLGLGDDVADKTLVNDLDLKVTDPTGNTVLPYVLDGNNPTALATRAVNTVDNTEEVEIKAATPGTYHVKVTATHIGATAPRQDFVVVSNAALGSSTTPCSDAYEPNDTDATAFTLVSGEAITARTCSAGDADFFHVSVNRSGPLSFKVSATDTPIRVTLSGNGITPVVVNIAAGATQTASTNVGSGTNQPVSPAQVYTVKVEATGTIGSSAAYSLTPTFNFASPAHRRLVGH